MGSSQFCGIVTPSRDTFSRATLKGTNLKGQMPICGLLQVPVVFCGFHRKSSVFQESPRQTKPKKGQFMNFSQGHSGTKVQCESCLFSQGKTPEFTKMGEIHELFVFPLSLVWFAGATPEFSAKICTSPTQGCW